jgi:hypothetical protein
VTAQSRDLWVVSVRCEAAVRGEETGAAENLQAGREWLVKGSRWVEKILGVGMRKIVIGAYCNRLE